MIEDELSAAPPTPEGVLAVAGRMLTAPKARDGISAFYRWWLRLEFLKTQPKAETLVLDDELRASMAREAPATGTYLTLDTDGRFDDLLSAPFTFVDERLARHYGIPAVTGSEMQRVPFDTTERVGIFGGAGVLTRFGSPWQPSWAAKRGGMIFDTTLCNSVPMAPFSEALRTDATLPIREQMITFTAPPRCMQCHYLLNPPGFAFMRFDTYGRYQPADVGGAIDTSGWIPAGVVDESSQNGPSFGDQPGLTRILADLAQVQRCFVQNWVVFAMHPEDGPATMNHPELESSVEEAFQSFEATGGKLRELILAVVRTRSFLSAPP